MPRVFVNEIPAVNSSLDITGDESKYVLKVLRMKKGSELELFDGSGNRAMAIVTGSSRSELKLEITSYYFKIIYFHTYSVLAGFKKML